MHPNYFIGFYHPRSAFRPKYPTLWNGCIGSWATCLGQGGTFRVFDWSHLKANATPINLTPATAWGLDEGKWSITLDGVDDHFSSYCW